MYKIGRLAKDTAGANVGERIDRRILPFLLVCYLFACLDRLNIGFVKLQMQSDLGLSDAVYGVGAGVFFLGYAMLEIPSNLLLLRFGAAKTISRILVLWGLTSASMLFVRDARTFYGLRFLLGIFEAGFTPAMIFYLTCWYGESRMAKAIALVMLGGPLAGVLGGPLSARVMSSFGGVFGLSGWQWMFLAEGLPCVVLGLVARAVLVDSPDQATWLSDVEKLAIRAQRGAQSTLHHSFASVIKDSRVYLLAAAYFCIICGIYVTNFWLPSILRVDGVKDTMAVGLLSSIPFAAAGFGMVFAGQSSDRRRERRWHSAMPALAGAAALGLAAICSGELLASLTCMTVATAMMWASYTVFWAIPAEYLKGGGAAGGIALINTIGVLGGFFSPVIIGWTHSITGSLMAGLFVLVGIQVVGGILLLTIRLPRAPSFELVELSDQTLDETRTFPEQDAQRTTL